MDDRPMPPLPGQLAFPFLEDRPAAKGGQDARKATPELPCPPAVPGMLFGDLGRADGPYGSRRRRA